MSFVNNVKTSLHAALTNSATSVLVVKSTSPFNDPPTSGNITLMDSLSNPSKIEVISYTGRTDNSTYWTLTGATRGVESSTASSFSVGAYAIQTWTAGDATAAVIDTTYSVGDGGLTTNDFTNADHSKLNAIEASADVTDTANVVSSLTAGTNVAIAVDGTISSTDTDTTYSVGDGGLTQQNFTTTLKDKLDDIEASATADQNKADIDSLGINATHVSGFTVGKSVPSNAVFTDANTTYTSSDFTHDDLTGFVANEHLDWTTDRGANNIHLSNLPATALTTVKTAVSQVAQLALTTEEGDVVVRSDESKTYMHNGGVAGTMADFTLLATPTDSVTSVNGANGVVVLTHDGFSDFVADEHLDWTADQGAKNIHANNYTDNNDNTEYTAGTGLSLSSTVFSNSAPNVSTNLSKTATVTNVTVNSSDGTNVALGAASTTVAGVMTKALYDNVIVNNAKVSDINHNVSTNLSTTHNASTVVINSSDGNNATINAATATTAGIMSEAIFDQHELNNAKETDVNHNVTTNLSTATAATTVTVNSSDGTNAVLPAATTTVAGVQTGADKLKLDGIATNATANVGDITGVATTSPITGGGTSGSVTITHSDAAGNKHIPTAGAAGQFLKYSSSGTAVWATPSYIPNTNTEYTASSGITLTGTNFTNAAPNVSTNLSKTTTASNVTVNSSDGNNIALGAASATVAGVMTKAMFDQHVLNNAKVSDINHNETHTGEVTGATALTITDDVVDEANLKVSNAPTDGYMLTAQSANTGGLTWAAAPTQRGIDDIPVEGETAESITSNWAFDHAASSNAHPRDTRNQLAGTYNNYLHPNHSGDVVSAADGAMTIQTDAVDIAMLSATGTAGSTTFLRGDNTWATAGSTSASDLTSGTLADARFPATLPAISGANLTNLPADSTKLPLAGGTMSGDIGLTGSGTKLDSSGGIYADLGGNVNHTFDIKNTTTATNSAANILTLEHYTSGNPVAGFGAAVEFRGENPQHGTSIYGSVAGVWEGASSNPSGGALVFSTDGYSGGNTERMRIKSTGEALFASTITWSGGGSANANTAYTHSQAAHAPSNANYYSHPNHSGDVVSASDGAMTIQTDAVDIAMLSATGTASSTTFLRGDNTWVTPTDTDTDTVYVHPNHSGDVVSTADGATVIQVDAVDIPMLSATGTAGSTTFLRGDNTWTALSIDGLSDGYSAGNSIGLGDSALNVDDGTNNTNIAIGSSTLLINTTGTKNIAIGEDALVTNVYHSGSVAIGYKALTLNRAHNNTAIGVEALATNATGGSSVAVGYQALNLNTNGSQNVSVGAFSMKYSVSGGSNTALGSESLYVNNGGYNNVAAGKRAMYDNIGGTGNVALGAYSLGNNTEGDNNISIGLYSSLLGSTGDLNIAIGKSSLQSNSSGSGNIALGTYAGKLLEASNNTVIGELDGTAIMTDTVLIGAGSTERIKVTSAGLFINESTTALVAAPSLGTASVIRTNANTISENITIPSGTNGMSAGPITIADGYTVTVTGTWSIV